MRTIKMIGLDLDGTLLNREKKLTTYSKEILKEAICQGMIVLVATGRPLLGFCYICVDLPEVAQQEAAFLGIFFCVEEATAATIPFFTAQKPVCTEKCQIHLSTVLI